jgi:glycosyltransferase involved in cell wall biosynthesis
MRLRVFIWQGDLRGGAERVTLGIAETFRKFGIEPVLGVFEKLAIDFQQIVAPRRFPEKFVAYNTLYVSWYLRRRGILNKFDIVIAHGGGAWKTEKNFYVYHEAANLDELFKHLPWKSKLAYWLPYKISIDSLKKADLVVSASRKCDTFLQKHGITSFARTHTFVDTSIFRPLRKDREKDSFKVLFVGRPDPIKNFQNLKKACEQIKELELLVAGISGKNEKNVRYLGWVEWEKLPELYNSVNLFALPSFYEGFPASILEALACNTPVLVSENACPIEVQDFVIKCKTDSFSIENKLHFVMENYAKIRKMATRGGEFVRKNFEKNKVLKGEVREILARYRNKYGKLP